MNNRGDKYAAHKKNLFSPQIGLTKSTLRFHDIKSKQLKFDVFFTPFNFISAPHKFQLELIKLQSHDTLKVMYLNNPLAQILSCLCIKERISSIKPKFTLSNLEIYSFTVYCYDIYGYINYWTSLIVLCFSLILDWFY